MSEELALTRVFDAPRDQVWQAWTDPEWLKYWFAPRGFTMTSCSFQPQLESGSSPRGGTAFKYSLRTPEGQDMWGSWVFSVVTPETLEFHVSLSDEQGGTTVLRMSPNWPAVRSRIEFKAQGKCTELTVRWIQVNATQVERKAFDEWAGTLDHLAAYLARPPMRVQGDGGPASEGLVIRRVFDAPRDQVLQAWTDPERLKQWFAPQGCAIASYEVLFNPRIGGGTRFNYCLRTPEGQDMWGSWVIKGMTSHQLSFDVSLSDERGGTTVRSMHCVIKFKAQGKWTELTMRWLGGNDTEVERKAFDEWAGTLDHLAAYLARDP